MRRIGIKTQSVYMFSCAFFFLFLFGTKPLWSQDKNIPEFQGPHVSDELLIQVKAGVAREKIAEVLKGHGASIEQEIPQIRMKKIKLPAHALEKVKEVLSRDPHIEFVEENYLAEGSAIPSDVYYSSQWHLPMISAPEAWDISTGSNDEAIAIIDSGVDATHPDLSNKLLSGYNFLGENTDTRDVLGHGTAVAGAAAAQSNNLDGIAGVAWQNPIMPLVVLNSNNYATYYNIARAVIYAADRAVRVINISIGGTSPSSTLQNAVNYAWDRGAILFASAMNNATSTPYYPAACTNVMAISATTSSDTRAGWSNYGNWVALSAPGESILTTSNGGGYGPRSGTSFSSPIVAGVAGLIFSANPSLINQDVADILMENSDDLGVTGFDPYFGFGRVNAYRSLLAAIDSGAAALPPEDTTAPSVAITYPSNESTVRGGLTISVSATDDVGVSEVALYVNGSLYATANSSPYNFFWDTTLSSNGTYDIVAVASDLSRNAGQSESVRVYVSNDTTAPSVAITYPSNESTVKGGLTISVSATDDVGVSAVALYVNGSLYATANSSPYNFFWDTAQSLDGDYEIVAVAHDLSGNMGQSGSVWVDVANNSDTISPTVSITSPLDGSYVKGKLNINVTASDNVGVSRIELYIDGILKSSVLNRSSLKWSWNTASLSKGKHLVLAKGYDAAGNIGTRTITVYKK
jgi:thermitase